MKKLSILLFVLISYFGMAQNPIENNISNFDTIKVFDLITVNLVKSSENKIIISGKDAQDVEYIERAGLLKVRMKREKIFDGTKTFVHVYYTDIDTIDGNEGARIQSNELMEQENLEIKLQEGAIFKAGMTVKNLNIRAVTGGIVEITGQVENQNIVVNTGGIVENARLKTDYTNVKVQAGGEVEVYASLAVNINVRAGGDVMVYGNPEQVEQKTLLGGRIKIMN